MELKIISIGDKGDLQNERIGLEAIKDCELKFYQLFRTEFVESGNFYNRSTAVYWFAPRSIKAKDRVVIYTRTGNDNSEVKEDGSTVHFLYWGLTEPIFNKPNNGVVLVEINSWENSRNK